MTLKVDGTNGLLQNYDYQVPTTGFSYTFTTSNVLVMNPAGTLATGTITMPASPVDGMTVSFSSTQAITALTVNANTGQTIAGNPTSLVANGSASFIYRLSSTKWFPIASANGVTSVDGQTGAVTLSSLPAFAKSLSSTGYQKLPSGLIIQWGAGTSATGGNYNAFAIAFPNSCFTVSGSPNDTPATGVYACVYSISTSGFYVVNNAGGSRTFWWIATGY